MGLKMRCAQGGRSRISDDVVGLMFEPKEYLHLNDGFLGSSSLFSNKLFQYCSPNAATEILILTFHKI